MSQERDSDEDIAELRMQALLTKKLNEAEVSSASSGSASSPYNKAGSQVINLSSYQNYFESEGAGGHLLWLGEVRLSPPSLTLACA